MRPTESVTHLRTQALKCRNLAATSFDQRLATALRAMADEYDERARKLIYWPSLNRASDDPDE